MAEGWLGGPRDISASGDVGIFDKGNTNIAFRFGFFQFEKLRARDDLMRNIGKLETATLAPITSRRGAILLSCLRTSMELAFL